jgi:uncharacterized caspase-like protein
MMIRCNSVLCLAVLAMVFVIAPWQAAPEKRVALVISNNAYDDLGCLNNPVNDAKLMMHSLLNLGFDVAEHTDADEKAMKRAIQEFGRRIERTRRDTVSLFLYAGHGKETNSVNYLLPIKERI